MVSARQIDLLSKPDSNCLFLELSHQPSCPHDKHNLKYIQVSPIFSHSSQPFVFASGSRLTCCICTVTVNLLQWLYLTSTIVPFSYRGQKYVINLFGDIGMPTGLVVPFDDSSIATFILQCLRVLSRCYFPCTFYFIQCYLYSPN